MKVWPNYHYVQGIISPNVGDELFRCLDTQLDWDRRQQNRREYWTNDFNLPYTYGKNEGIRTYEAKPSNYEIDMIRSVVKNHLHYHFQGCFVNYYEGQHDYLGWHADNSDLINHNHEIVVVTLGHPRRIQVRDNGKVFTQTILLEHGSMFVMPAGSQQTHQHRIPKTDRPVGPRISLTFRALHI